MGAAGSVVCDLAFAIRALAGFGCGFGRCGGFFILGTQLVDELDEHENAQSEDEEVDNGLNEITVCKNGSFFSGAELVAQLAEIYTAGDGGDDGSEQIFDDAVDDAGESAADQHTDCHVDDIAFKGEFLEFLHKLAHK